MNERRMAKLAPGRASSMIRGCRLILSSLAVSMLVGCVGPVASPSPIAKKTATPAFVPPTGKTLVLIHRPRAYAGYKLYTGVWEGLNFIADLGNGHSTAYTCEPGRHYFINRSVERVGVVEAQLLADQTYDLWLDTAGAFVASFQLEPVRRNDPEWQKVRDWSQQHQWVERNPKADAHERDRTSEIELILKDFVGGEKQDRLRLLKTDDHR